MSRSYSTGETVEVEVVKIVPNGLGLAFAENLTLFIPLTVPGDKVVAEIADLKGRTAFARIKQVVEAGPARTDPTCRYFGECGGCDFQQMTYEGQLRAKAGIIEDSLKRIAGISGIEVPVVPSPSPFGYRIRTQVHGNPATLKIGFYKRQSHDVIEAETCPILATELDEKVTEIRRGFDWSNAGAEKFNIEAGFSGGAASVYSDEIFETVEEMTFEAFGTKYRFDARSFFQANRFMIEALIEEVVGQESGGLAVDLFCGIGLFTLPLSERFESVIGVESSKRSFGFAEKNTAAAGRTNIRLHNQRVKQFLLEQRDAIEAADLVVIDPPRSGVKDSALKAVMETGPARVNYVSCNPSTFARDVRTLIDGGYELASIKALDLFPQTHHVEAVARLVRRS